MSRIAFKNFAGGEVTPTLCARYDLKKFQQCSLMQSCRNFLPNLHGDIERRPGTKYIADLGANSILIPFQFNTEPTNNYVLIFQSGTIKVAQADGMLEATMSNPYNMNHVYDISFAQVADVLYLAHPSYALRKITRSGSFPYTWAIGTVPLNQSLPAPGRPSVSWHRGVNDGEPVTDNETSKLRYVVTSVDADGVESIASKVGSCTGRYPTDWVVGDKVELEWAPVSGAESYNIFRESAGYYGFIGNAASSQTRTTGYTVVGLTVGGVAYTKTSTKYRVEEHTSSYYDSNTDTTEFETYFTLSSSGDNRHHVWEGPSDYWVYRTYGSSYAKWWRVAKGDLGADFDMGDVTVWQGSQNNGEYPSGSAGGVSISLSTTGGDTVVYFTDENFEPDTATTPKVNWNPFANGNNPTCVAFHQQRMWLGGGSKNPATIYASRTGDYESFRKSRPLQDDDALEYVLASGSVDDVKWLVSFDSLLIGTAGAEYKAAASKTAAITPSDCQITVQSYWGSKSLQPLVIGQSIMHCQRSGSHVRDLYYTLESDGYAGNDLSVLAPQLVETFGIKQWCYQQSPVSTVWAVRSDGTLLALTYMREQNIFGWSRHVTDGQFVSVAVISGDDEDVVMAVVKRTVNGSTKYYLERVMPRFKDSTSIADAWYVDCGMVVTPTLNEDNRRVVCSGLTHLAGKTVSVLADGSPEEHVVSASGTFELTFPASKALVGLGFTSVMSPLPLETDMDKGGSTVGKRRAYGKCIARMYRSVGGSYAASRPNDLWNADAWKELDFYELPFLPAKWGEACQPYSGDLEISLPSGQDPDTTIWFKQDKPLPMRIVALTADVEFGEI